MGDMYWDRRNAEHRARFGGLLAPLVAASRTKDFDGVERATVQLHAWMLSLQDVPADVLEEAIGHLVRRGVTWMPKPGDVKSECAQVVRHRRAHAARRYLATCDHAGYFVENERGQMERCPCFRRAMTAMSEVAAPLALPSWHHPEEVA